MKVESSLSFTRISQHTKADSVKGFGALMHRLEKAMWDGSRTERTTYEEKAETSRPFMENAATDFNTSEHTSVPAHRSRAIFAYSPGGILPTDDSHTLHSLHRGVSAPLHPARKYIATHPQPLILNYYSSHTDALSRWQESKAISFTSLCPEHKSAESPIGLTVTWNDDGADIHLVIDSAEAHSEAAIQTLRDLRERGIPVARLTINGRLIRNYHPTERNSDGHHLDP